MPASRLTRLQRDLLREFSVREQRFFLTGGAALAGFHLGHRETDDLDLFTELNVLEEGRLALEQAAGALGATLQAISDSPAHKRFVVRRDAESVRVDLALDALQLLPKLAVDDRLRIDAPEEIAANKLTALLSRSELRDLVDLRALERFGCDLEQTLALAMRKDAGLTPGQLVLVLSEIRIGDDAQIPGGVSAAKLRRYLEGLIDRLARLAYPRPRCPGFSPRFRPRRTPSRKRAGRSRLSRPQPETRGGYRSRFTISQKPRGSTIGRSFTRLSTSRS